MSMSSLGPRPLNKTAAAAAAAASVSVAVSDKLRADN